MESSNRRIEVSTEVRNKIIKTFGVTGKTVSNALNYTGERGQTDLAKRIRIMALENGGRHMASWPECETIHDANGMMRQIFDNGATIEVDKQTGDAQWFHHPPTVCYAGIGSIILTIKERRQIWSTTAMRFA